MRIYIASKSKHAARWREYRASGAPISCTWIDEAGPGETTDPSSLAARCLAEASEADCVVLYAGPGEIQAGALLECGAALAAGKPVIAVGTPANFGRIFLSHPSVRRADDVETALRLAHELSNTLTPTGA